MILFMTQCGFKQLFFTKASFENKSKWADEPEICYKKYDIFCHFFLHVNLESKN